MDQKFHNDLIAELAALNQAVHQILHVLARDSGNRAKFLEAQLEQGLAAMERTNLWSVPEGDRPLVTENAKARYSDILGSVKR